MALGDIKQTSELIHGKGDHGSGVLATYFNVVCVTAGVGILNLPKSIAQGGWASIAFVIISAIMAIYTSLLLIQCLYAREDRKLVTYPEIGYEAFGRLGQRTIQTCHYSILLGAGTLCILLAGLNFKDILAVLGVEVSEKVTILVAGIIIGVPYCLLRAMKEFVWMAIFGFLTTLITLIIVVVVALVELPMVDGTKATTQPIIWSGLSTSLAVLSLAYAGNVVHPHLEGAMANPKRWPVALTLGLGTVCVFYLLMSIVGYYVYGESAEEIIFSNLRAVVPANFSRTLISVHVLMTGPILLCSFGLEFETMLSITPEAMGVKKSALLRVFSRGITVAILTIVAMFIPHFMAIMGIIGAFFNCLNLYHFPIFCHVRLFGLRGRSLVEYIVMLITLSIATICFFWGGYNAIIGMVEAIKSSSA